MFVTESNNPVDALRPAGQCSQAGISSMERKILREHKLAVEITECTVIQLESCRGKGSSRVRKIDKSVLQQSKPIAA